MTHYPENYLIYTAAVPVDGRNIPSEDKFNLEQKTGLHHALWFMFYKDIERFHPTTAKANNSDFYLEHAGIVDLATSRTLLSIYRPEAGEQPGAAIYLKQHAGARASILEPILDNVVQHNGITGEMLIPIFNFDQQRKNMLPTAEFNALHQRIVEMILSKDAKLNRNEFESHLIGRSFINNSPTNNPTDGARIVEQHSFQYLRHATEHFLSTPSTYFDRVAVQKQQLPVIYHTAALVINTDFPQPLAKIMTTYDHPKIPAGRYLTPLQHPDAFKNLTGVDIRPLLRGERQEQWHKIDTHLETKLYSLKPELPLIRLQAGFQQQTFTYNVETRQSPNPDVLKPVSEDQIHDTIHHYHTDSFAMAKTNFMQTLPASMDEALVKRWHLITKHSMPALPMLMAPL
ncbi:hypothetical protein MKQ70_32405 [Chitinophaga sedimenti]|uniref:hypothetical protein n=1 Tax=Chitinophaga sedimenti TaxID=2033606 RepID=UPI002005A4EA|nr:hypothetical protein [Chitinophaga sedimenti]MCK7559420.1 hypothetical protein [Chitinophaga sedimenti]